MKEMSDIRIVVNEEFKTFRPNSETEYGEPQIWIYMSDGTSVEVCYEQYGLETSDFFFSVRRHCSDEDFDSDKYRGTMGIMEHYTYNTRDDLERGLGIFLQTLSGKGVAISEELGKEGGL